MLNFDDVLKKWEGQGVELLPPKDRAGVIKTLDSTGRKYSEDVIQLYCTTGGMKDWGMDNHAWSFWPLDQLVKENAHHAGTGLLFADFLIHSHFYWFQYECKERSSVWFDYGDEGQEIIANSISEFFALYLSNPKSLGMID